MQPEEKQTLAARVAAVDADLGAVIADPETTLEELETPLGHTRLFVAEQFLPTRPLLIYFACHETGPTFVLNQNRDAFNRMMAAERQPVSGPQAAMELARLFLMTTRPQDERFLVVTTADEVPWMPGADPAKLDEARRQLDEHLVPPAVRPLPEGGFEVDFRVVHDHSLEEVKVRLNAAGQARASSRTLAEKLPLAYVGG